MTESSSDRRREWDTQQWWLVARRSVKALLLTLAAIYLLCWLVYNRVPSGVRDPWAYMLASYEIPDLVSPNGKQVLKVRYNDAGAAHSGNHWTWIIRRNIFGWDEVVAQGYVVTPWESTFAWWLDDDTCEIRFVPDRYAHVSDEPIILFYKASSGRVTTTLSN